MTPPLRQARSSNAEQDRKIVAFRRNDDLNSVAACDVEHDGIDVTQGMAIAADDVLIDQPFGWQDRYPFDVATLRFSVLQISSSHDRRRGVVPFPTGASSASDVSRKDSGGEENKRNCQFLLHWEATFNSVARKRSPGTNPSKKAFVPPKGASARANGGRYGGLTGIDVSLNLEVRYWIRPTVMREVVESTDEVYRAIAPALTAAGIDMPFPTYQILLHDQTEEADGDRNRQREGWPPPSLSLTPMAVILALSVWSWIWGVAGALIAVPMTSAAVVLCNQFPSVRWIATILSDDHAVPDSESNRTDGEKSPR